jgi:hypothetical protein
LNFRAEFVIEAKLEINGYRILKSPNIAFGFEKSKSKTLFSNLKVREVLMVVICRNPKDILSALIYFSSKITPLEASKIVQSSGLSIDIDLMKSSGFEIKSSSC